LFSGENKIQNILLGNECEKLSINNTIAVWIIQNLIHNLLTFSVPSYGEAPLKLTQFFNTAY